MRNAERDVRETGALLVLALRRECGDVATWHGMFAWFWSALAVLQSGSFGERGIELVLVLVVCGGAEVSIQR